MDWKSVAIVSLVLLVVGGVIGALFVGRKSIAYETRVYYKTVEVPLTQSTLDSLELAFSVKVKAKTKIVLVKDTSSIQQKDSLENVVRAYRDSIIKMGDILLVSEIDSLGKYGDSLYAVASFGLETIAIDFRPRDRDYSAAIPDTIRIPVPSDSFDFWDILERVGYILFGALVASLGG